MFRQHTARWLAAATLAALAVIVWGALFCIAPVWQLSAQAAPYRALTAEQTAPSVVEGQTLVNINTAGAEELMTLPQIGPARAQAILAYREANGPFTSLEQLDEVEGISQRMVESWSGRITLTEPRSAGGQTHGQEETELG